MPVKPKPKKTTKKKTGSSGKKKTQAKKKSIKKTVPKKTPKKKSPSKKIKADIEKAVDHIPSLIVEQVKFNEPTKKALSPRPKVNIVYASKAQSKRRTLMWVGVGIITLVVFIMWFWNARSTLIDIRNNKNTTAEGQIINNARADLRTIMLSIAAGDDDELSETLEEVTPNEDIKNSLRATIGSLLDSSSTATPTSTLSTIATSTDALNTTTLSQ